MPYQQIFTPPILPGRSGYPGILHSPSDKIHSKAFSDVMCAVTSKAEYVDDIMHTNLPYTQETNDYGSALGNLVRKGLLVLEGDSVYLSPEGQYVYGEFAGMEIDKTLLIWQFEANDLYEGDQTGRSVINGF